MSLTQLFTETAAKSRQLDPKLLGEAESGESRKRDIQTIGDQLELYR